MDLGLELLNNILIPFDVRVNRMERIGDLSSLRTLNQQEKKYTAELDVALAQYTVLQQQAADMDVICFFPVPMCKS